ncbi:transcriptional regulator with XRE-family HTH domain [Sphingomonas sp. SORGH_AS870]|uniref:helix-turn-helix domain-containing protein n=1 Tax=Sphingomonas sp. SORGH_AS_0870 TaxID=3041801 RepID=UPI00285BEE14|nr:helix-turn-helix transcriptional regulator [Sphingomonas sp. SORGH_AS_0870]MDR6144350.1 transcriptional regulator with XRE-family HTH domain [Sphingomonas sp. SORGH_AS_0870]
MASKVAWIGHKGHIWTMLHTPSEIAADLGRRIQHRRLAMNLTQVDAAARAGVSYRTWRRLEAEGKASIDDLVRAAVALRCEQDLFTLFPEPVASSMDALLEQKRMTERTAPKRRRRAASRATS